MKRIHLSAIQISLIALILAVGWFFLSRKTAEDYQEDRVELACSTDQEEVWIGVVSGLTSDAEKFQRGVELAVDEINQKGGVLIRVHPECGQRVTRILCEWNPFCDDVNFLKGTEQVYRPLRVQYEMDFKRVEDGKKIAERLAKNPKIVAVIGHPSTTVALPASVTYQRFGLLYLATGATHPQLTNHRFENVFRVIPSDEVITKQLEKYIRKQGWKRVIIFHQLNLYGNSFAHLFREHADENGKVSVVISRSFSLTSENQLRYNMDDADLLRILKLLRQEEQTPDTNENSLHSNSETNGDSKENGDSKDNVRSYEPKAPIEEGANDPIDAIILGAGFPGAELVINDLRRLNVRQPILAGEAIHDIAKLEKMSIGSTLVAATMLNPHLPTPAARQFYSCFLEKYDKSGSSEKEVTPDSKEAVAYDAVHILSAAIEKSDNLSQSELSTMLRATKDLWTGATTSFSFDVRGEIIGGSVYLDEFFDGKRVADIQISDLEKCNALN